jgi:hypothetical protein
MPPETRMVQKVGRLLRLVTRRFAAGSIVVLPLGRRGQMGAEKVANRNQEYTDVDSGPPTPGKKHAASGEERFANWMDRRHGSVGSHMKCFTTTREVESRGSRDVAFKGRPDEAVAISCA